MYDRIGADYAAQRVADPHIAALVERCLGDAHTICNVGAGAGSYEPADRAVCALEPSRTMLAQRPSRERVVRGVAEQMPFCDSAFDAALAVLSVHHWRDPRAGLAEMRRVARRRVVLCFDALHQDELWLVRDYLPEIREMELKRAIGLREIADALDAREIVSVPVPWDCSDGFQSAYWRRPERYLDPAVRASISTLAQLDPPLVERAMGRLAADLDSGAWERRNADLLEREEVDYGYRLVVSVD